MADVMTPEQRSQCMAAIRGKDTKPEMIVRKFLFSKGLRYRIQVKNLSGCPDIVFPKYRTVIFVNGCFWHGHEGCKYFRLPKSNVEFWSEKIKTNIARDLKNEARLREQGWRVIRVWECSLKTVATRNKFLEGIYEDITVKHKGFGYEVESPALPIAAEPEAEYGSEL